MADEREVLLILVGGQRLKGILVSQDAAEIVLRIASVDTRIARDQVERVVPQPTLRERYAEMRAVIDDQDVDRLLLLVEWLRTHKLYEEALREVDHVLAVEPRNGEALRLEQIIRKQLQMRDRTAPGDAPPTEEEPAAKRVRRPTPGEFPLLTDEQINLIKVYELDLSESPRVLIDREVVRDFVAAYAGAGGIPSTRDGKAAFERSEPLNILKSMFELRAREFYPRVKVQGVPASLRRFRDQVQSTWLVNSCATTRCHGGEEAGRLLLYNRAPASEAAAFTNFLILERARSVGGQPLIDYALPERSTLLQMGLPRDDAVVPHPNVYGWAPTFRSRDDRRFQQAVDWIRSMHQPRPDYPIEFVPPSAERRDAPGETKPEAPPQPDR